MNLQIVWTNAAASEYDDLTATVQKQIDEAMYELAVHQRGDVTRLTGIRPPEYRLRTGDYRVRFALPQGKGEIVVLHVLPRDKAYRG